ncbi:hypothetical protein M758_6G117200 [Ceratodon purpureus]|nr:hypothetical protein M758_6G117200 [Ceratodon purpureus]
MRPSHSADIVVMLRVCFTALSPDSSSTQLFTCALFLSVCTCGGCVFVYYSTLQDVLDLRLVAVASGCCRLILEFWSRGGGPTGKASSLLLDVHHQLSFATEALALQGFRHVRTMKVPGFGVYRQQCSLLRCRSVLSDSQFFSGRNLCFCPRFISRGR